MSRSATTGITGAKTNQNPTDNQDGNHFWRLENVIPKQSVGQQFSVWGIDSQLGQLGNRFGIDAQQPPNNSNLDVYRKVIALCGNLLHI